MELLMKKRMEDESVPYVLLLLADPSQKIADEYLRPVP